MLKLPHNCTHLIHELTNAQNSPSQASAIHEPWTSRCSSWFYKRQRNQRSNCQHLLEKHWKNKRVPEKNIYFCFNDYAKAFDYVDHNKLWKILKEMGIPDHLTCLLRNLYLGQKATEKQSGSKLGKESVKAVSCHPAYLTDMQSTSWETLGWMKHKLESRLLGGISTSSDMQMIPPYGRKWRRTKEPLDESERGEWEDWLKAQHSEN